MPSEQSIEEKIFQILIEFELITAKELESKKEDILKKLSVSREEKEE